MNVGNPDIHSYLQPGKRAHLVGIGGVSMASLAEVLHDAGVKVTGSDQKESATVWHLRDLNIPITIGHLPENVKGADCIIRTAAVHDNNPEITAARAAGIPVFERAQTWGAIMQKYKNAVCISGTHGKTTTTSMCTHIFMAAQTDPTVMIGGTLPLLEACHRVGHGDTIILESCEYCNSFLSFFPTVAVVLNIDEDHLDFFKDLDDIKHSFRKFMELVPSSGNIIVNADDANACSVAHGLDAFTFGLSDGADCTIKNVLEDMGRPEFDIYVHGEFYAHAALQVCGRHNISNALAAASAAYVLGIPGDAVEKGLSAFQGAGRRFEHKGNFNGAELYDDYAHHPNEVRALLETAESLGYKRIICAFQPHTYSRTHELFDDFVEILKRPDITILAEIFAAREDNELGISSADLAVRIPNSIYCATLEEVEDKLRELAQPGDLLLTVGAGDIYLAGEALLG